MRMNKTFMYALLPRYAILTLFFVIGTVMQMAVSWPR